MEPLYLIIFRSINFPRPCLKPSCVLPSLILFNNICFFLILCSFVYSLLEFPERVIISRAPSGTPSRTFVRQRSSACHASGRRCKRRWLQSLRISGGFRSSSLAGPRGSALLETCHAWTGTVRACVNISIWCVAHELCLWSMSGRRKILVRMLVILIKY